MEFTELCNTHHNYQYVETWTKTLGTFLPEEHLFPKAQGEPNRSPKFNVHNKRDQNYTSLSIRGE